MDIPSILAFRQFFQLISAGCLVLVFQVRHWCSQKLQAIEIKAQMLSMEALVESRINSDSLLGLDA